jgi:hypothetical protein
MFGFKLIVRIFLIFRDFSCFPDTRVMFFAFSLSYFFLLFFVYLDILIGSHQLAIKVFLKKKNVSSSSEPKAVGTSLLGFDNVQFVVR